MSTEKTDIPFASQPADQQQTLPQYQQQYPPYPPPQQGYPAQSYPPPGAYPAPGYPNTFAQPHAFYPNQPYILNQAPTPRYSNNFAQAFAFAAILSWFVGPFALCLLCYYNGPRAKRGVFSGVALVHLIEGAIIIALGFTMRDRCQRALNDSQNLCFRRDNVFGPDSLDCFKDCGVFVPTFSVIGGIYLVVGIGAAVAAVFARKIKGRQTEQADSYSMAPQQQPSA